MGTNCEACQGKHRAHTCKVVRRTTRGRTRRSPLEAVENALSFCAPGPRMLRMSCELCLAKDRKIAALELRLMDLESALIAAYDENIKEAEEELEKIKEEKIKRLEEEKMNAATANSESESESEESEKSESDESEESESGDDAVESSDEVR